MTTVVATVVLIGLGGYVRAMEAGLGCPDWPTCFGALNPPAHLADDARRLAWIEHSHRLFAGGVILLVIALAVAAVRSAQPRGVRVASLWLVPAVLSQAFLGAIVVWLDLRAESVMLHLAGALTVLGLGVYVATRSWPVRQVSVSPRIRRLTVATAAVVFVQMLVGSAVAGFEAGLAYTTFPSFDGRVLPAATSELRPWLHVSHRVLAFGLVLMVVALAVRAWRTPLRSSTVLACGLVAVQMVLGALNIWYRVPAWSVVPHLVVGALIWATLVLAAQLLAHPGQEAVEA